MGSFIAHAYGMEYKWNINQGPSTICFRLRYGSINSCKMTGICVSYGIIWYHNLLTKQNLDAFGAFVPFELSERCLAVLRLIIGSIDPTRSPKLTERRQRDNEARRISTSTNDDALAHLKVFSSLRRIPGGSRRQDLTREYRVPHRCFSPFPPFPLLLSFFHC
jgi:hypothetical protein